MKFNEFNKLNEGMDFHAYKKDERGVWEPVTGGQPHFQDVVYTKDFDQSGKDAFDYVNPDYKEEHDLHLSNMSAYDVFDTIGYDTDATIPIDEFIARTTQWLQKNIGKRSKEEPSQVDKQPGGMTMISGGKPEGYYNRIIKRMNEIARDGKKMGATHVGVN